MEIQGKIDQLKQLVQDTIADMTSSKPATTSGPDYFRQTFSLFLGKVNSAADEILDRASFEMDGPEHDQLGLTLQTISEKGLDAYGEALGYKAV